jgi:hypothetical protein
MSQQHYPKQFYEVRDEGSAASARVVLGLLYKFYRPQSVIDQSRVLRYSDLERRRPGCAALGGS